MVLLLKQQEQYQYLVEDQHYMGNVDCRGLAHDVSEKNQDSLGNWSTLSRRIWLCSAHVQKI